MLRIRSLLDLLYEAPIEDYQLVGNFDKNSAFRHEADRKLLTNPKAEAKVKQMWSKTGINFKMYFVNNPEANRFVEVGMVDINWMQQNMPKTLAEINTRGGFGQNSFNIMYNGNKGAEWFPLTGWIMAHRMGHALMAKPFANDMVRTIEADCGDRFKTILNSYGMQWPKGDYYGRVPFFNTYTGGRQAQSTRLAVNFLQQIGQMKSARDGQLRTPFEFLCECFAQFIMTGQVTFNPAPELLVVSHTYGRPNHRRIYSRDDLSEANIALEYCADMMTQEFEAALEYGLGHIFII